MAKVNIFEWEGSYAISGLITPALAENDTAVITVRAVGTDDRITFQDNPGDSIDIITDSEDISDIIINVPGGSDKFLIPLDIEDTSEEEGDLSIDLTILSFVVNGGAVQTDIAADNELEVIIVDDEVTANFSLGSVAASADVDNSVTIPFSLDRATAEDVVVSITAVGGNGVISSDFTLPSTFTLTGNLNLAEGQDSVTSGSVELVIDNAAARGYIDVTVQVQSGNAVGLGVAQIEVEGTGTSISAGFVNSAPLVRSETQEGGLGLTVLFSEELPTDATLEFTVSPTPDARLVNTTLGATLESTFTVPALATRESTVLPVSLVDAPGEQGDQTFVFTLTSFTSNSPGFVGSVGANSSRNVTLLDDEVPAVVTISSPSEGTTLLEGGSDALITASLDRVVSDETVIEIAQVGGDALVDTDYVLDNRIVIPAGELVPTDNEAAVIILDTCRPNRTLEIGGAVIAGSLADFDDEDADLFFTLSGDGNPVSIQFSGGLYNATEGGPFELYFSASQELDEEVAATVLFPSERFPGLASEDYEVEVLIPSGVSSYDWEGTIPDTDTTQESGEVTFTLQAVRSTASTPVTTPLLGPDVTSEVYVTDNDIYANIQYTVGSMNLTAGDTDVVATLVSDRPVASDVVINIGVNGATASDIINEPASVTMLAGEDTVSFTFDVDAGATAGTVAITAGVASGPAVITQAGNMHRIVVTIDAAPVTNSVIALDNPGTITEFNEWVGGSVNMTGTITPAFPVSGNVVVSSIPDAIGGGNYASDTRITFQHGANTSGITIPVAAGVTTFNFDVFVSGNDIADYATLAKISRIAITDAESTDHEVSIPPVDNFSSKFIKITDDDIATPMSWGVDTTSVLIDDTTGQDLTITVTLDHGVSGDTDFEFGYSWREAYVGGSVTVPVITIPANSTTATGTVSVAPGTYQDFQITLSAVTGAGSTLITQDAVDQAPIVITAPDAPLPPGVALGAPTQIVYRTPNQNYLATTAGYATGPLSGYITTNIDHLVQAVVPIDPVVEAELPYFTIDGNQADVFPVSYDHDDKVRTVQVVAPAAPGYLYESVDLSLTSTSIDGSAILERVDSPGTATQTITNVNLDTLSLSLFVDDGTEVVDVRTPNFDQWTLVETLRDGDYINEKHYFTQFSEYPAGYTTPTGYSEKLLSVHAFVTQRSDVDLAEVVFTVANDVFDDTIGDRGADHPEVNGDVWFYGIKVNNPANRKMIEGSQWTAGDNGILVTESDPSINNGKNWLVRAVNETNENTAVDSVTRGLTVLQCMPKQTRLMRKTCFVTNNNQGRALAVYLNRFGGYGVAHPLAFDAGKPLGYCYQAKRGFGPQQDFMPAIDHVDLAKVSYSPTDQNWYDNFGSTGREIFRARTSGSLRLMRSAARSVSNGSLENGGIIAGLGWEVLGDYGQIFSSEPDNIKFNGWFRPYMHKDISHGGGKGITPRLGYAQCPEDIELGFMQTAYVMQRQRSSLTNLNGQVVEPEQIAKVTGDFHNNGDPIMPWGLDIWRGGAKGGMQPHFFGPLTDSSFAPKAFDAYETFDQTPPLAPTNRFWNDPDSTLPVAYLPINRRSEADSTELSKMKILFGDGHYKDRYSFNSSDGEHHFRVTVMTQCPIWYGNVGAIKDYMQRDAAFCRGSLSQYDVMDAFSYQGNSYQQKGRDAYVRSNLYYLAGEGKNRIYSNVGSQHTNRANGEPQDAIGMAYSILTPGAQRAKIKAEWLPKYIDATKNVMTPQGMSRQNDGLQDEINKFDAMTWDSTWQELCYLEPGLSGVQDILDLNDANFLQEYNRRKGGASLPNGYYTTQTQAITSYIYFAHGAFGILASMEGCDPENLGALGQALLPTLGYLPMRQWQWTERKRELLSPTLSALDNSSGEFWRQIAFSDRWDYLPQTGLITGVGKTNESFRPAMDFVPWTWGGSLNLWKVRGQRPIRDALLQGIAYRMTGDRRFLHWGAQMMFDQWKECQYDPNWDTSGDYQTGEYEPANDGLVGQVQCSSIRATNAASVVPSSIENAGRLWGYGAAQDYHSINTGNSIEPPTMVDPMAAHMAGWAGECVHQEWDLTYDPKRPPNYDEIKNSAHGQTYFQEATGNGAGVGFPDGTKKSTDVVADFVFSGTTITDNVSSLTMSDAGQGSVTLGTKEGVDFLDLANARMDIPASDADQILAALKATGTNQVTFEFWVRPWDVTNEGPARLMSWSHTDTPTGIANAQVTMSKYGQDSDYYGHLGAKTWNTNRYAAGNLYELEQGQLNHVVVSIDGTSCSGWVNTYNSTGGTQITQGIGNLTPWTPPALGRSLSQWTSGHTITVGDEKDDTVQGGGNTRHLNGEFYRMSIYKTVFTEADVSANYYAGPDADLGVITVTTPARAGFTTTLINEQEDADQKTITVTGSYNKPLETSTTLTVSASIPVAETRLTAPSFTSNTLDIELDAGESAFEFDLLMTSATGDQGTNTSNFYLTADSGADSEISTTASSCAVQLVDGYVDDGTGGTGGGGQGGGGSTGGGTGSMVTEITSPNGITWYFDQPVEAGQFVGGDWWVVGPVSVTAIDPAPYSFVDGGGETQYVNGSMIDVEVPSGIKEVTGHYRTDSHERDFTVDVSAMTFDTFDGYRPGREQGFISAWGEAGGDNSYNWSNLYVHSKNAAFPGGQVVGSNNPITLQAGQTLNSSWTQLMAPYDSYSSETFGVYVDGQHVRDLPMNQIPKSHAKDLIRNDGENSCENAIRTIEALTVVSEVPTGYTGGGTDGGGLTSVFRNAMLPSRLSAWYAPRTKSMKDVDGNNFTENVWQELNSIGVKTALRGSPWRPKNENLPDVSMFTQGSWETYSEDMNIVGVRAMGLSSDGATAAPTYYSKPHDHSDKVTPAVVGDPLENGDPVSYRFVGFADDDWPQPYSHTLDNGEVRDGSIWMLGHEPELARSDGEITPYDLESDGSRKWTQWDPNQSYTTGDRVYMIDTQSAIYDANGNPLAHDTMYGRTTIFEAKRDNTGVSPLWKIAPGYSDQYIPGDNADWKRIHGDKPVNWAHGWPAFIVKQRAEAFKAAYPEAKLYYFFSKGVCVAGWNGIDGMIRPGAPDDPVFGEYTDQLSYFSSIAGIDAFDGFMFDYYPFNSKPTGRSNTLNTDPPSVYVNPVTGGSYIVDDPKWVVSGVHRIKEWSVQGDFPDGKPVYVTLPSSPNCVSSGDTANANITGDGLLEYYHKDRPQVQEMKDLVLSCVNAGADGFIWYNHAWKCSIKDAAEAPWTPGDVKVVSAGQVADFWPLAYKNFFDSGGTRKNLHQLYFPSVPNVDVSGDGSWEMMTEVSQYILSLLPELEDSNNGGAIIPPLEDSPPPANAGGWFRPSPMGVEASQKVPLYHTSSVDEWLATGPFANLTAPINWNHDYFMTPAPLGYPLDDTNSNPGGMTEVPNPEDYYYLLPDGSKQVYWNPNGKNRVTATNQAVTDNVYTIHQTFNSDRQQYTYGANCMNRNDSVMLALNSDLAPEKKRDILIHYLQWGIDLDAMYRSGMRWPPNGDHNNGRYTPILLKRIVFGEDLSDLYAQDFSENRQSYIIPDLATANFHVCQSEDPNATATTSGDCTRYQVGYDWQKNGPPTDGLAIAADGSHNIQGKPFTEEQVGRTAWIQWGWPPFRGDQTKNLTADQKNPKYLAQTAKVGHGTAVGWRAMGKMDQYDAPQFFNIVDQKSLLGQDFPFYVDDNGEPINQQKRGINGGFTGSLPGGASKGRQRTAILYDLWRPIVGPDYSVSSDNVYNSSGLAFNVYSNRPAGVADGYTSLSAVLDGPFPGSLPPGGGTGGGGEPGDGGGDPPPGGTGGTGTGADLGEVGTNPFYAGVGQEGRGGDYLYPPAIDDSVTHPDGVINGANTGHRLWLSAMTVSAIPTTGDKAYTFAKQGDCGAATDCVEVPPAGLVVSGVVFSAVDAYEHNTLIRINNNMNYDLSFVDCLFIGQEHFFQRYSNNGGTVNTAELGNSTKNNGNSYLINVKNPGSSAADMSSVHFKWCSMRGCASKQTNIPFATMYRVNFDWVAADAVNLRSQDVIHFEECWWGDSLHVRGMTTCNPTDSPHLFDCSYQSTYNGYDVENCKPLYYTQCGHFAYGWTWQAGKEVHSDSYQNTNADIPELRFTKCAFSADPSLFAPKRSAAWDNRWLVNSGAKYSPLWHDKPEKLATMTVDGYPAPPTSTSATIFERMQDKNLQLDGATARHERIIFDRCHYKGAGSSYHSFNNAKFKWQSGSGGVPTRWVIQGCPDPSSPLYPGGGNDPAGSPGYEQFDSYYYIPAACNADTGYNPNYGTRYQEPTKWEFSGCTFAVANKSAMWSLNSGQNIGIPHDVLLDVDPNPAYSSPGPLSSCDELRAAGYTEANGWASMATCIDNFDAKEIITDGNNKFIDPDTAETCNNIRLNDGTSVVGSLNPAFSCEDMVQGNPLVGNNTSIVQHLNREKAEHWDDFTVYQDTFYHPDRISGVTGTNVFPVYTIKTFTSRERCQCED